MTTETESNTHNTKLTGKPEEKPVCFVIMPISDVSEYPLGHFGRVYEYLLKPAIIEAGYCPVRADDTNKTDNIPLSIIRRLMSAEMVVCDYSARNPNVMYELGIRHAYNKPVTFIKDKRTSRIFDIESVRYCEYDETLRYDFVESDRSRITSAITETAGSWPDDTNSIVQLARIQTAELPPTKTISVDTDLIFTAINDLSRQVRGSIIQNQLQSNVTFRNHVPPPSQSKVWVLDNRYIILYKGDVPITGDVVLDTKNNKTGQISQFLLQDGTITFLFDGLLPNAPYKLTDGEILVLVEQANK